MAVFKISYISCLTKTTEKKCFLRYSRVYGRRELANSTSCICGGPVTLCAPHCLRLFYMLVLQQSYCKRVVFCFGNWKLAQCSSRHSAMQFTHTLGKKLLLTRFPVCQLLTVDISVLHFKSSQRALKWRNKAHLAPQHFDQPFFF